LVSQQASLMSLEGMAHVKLSTILDYAKKPAGR